jgi:glucokinase
VSEIFIGIDLGGTNVKIGCFDGQMGLIAKGSTATETDAGPQAIVETVAQATEKLLAENNLALEAVTAVAIGAPGPANLAEGIIIASPNIPSFKNVPLRRMVSDRFGKPAVLENDANTACWGEFVLGAGKDVEDMVFFTLGTGIGGGVISSGKLIHGSADNAAELGHIIIYPDGRLCGCGQRGCVEAYASANATAARATEAVQAGKSSSLTGLLKQKGEITCKDVFEHAVEGDSLAKEIVDQTAKALAIICVNMLHTTEPKRIVFAGGMIAAGEVLLDNIKEHFDAQIWTLKKEPVEIAFATLGEDAGIIGAAALARHAQRQC